MTAVEDHNPIGGPKEALHPRSPRIHCSLRPLQGAPAPAFSEALRVLRVAAEVGQGAAPITPKRNARRGQAQHPRRGPGRTEGLLGPSWKKAG